MAADRSLQLPAEVVASAGLRPGDILEVRDQPGLLVLQRKEPEQPDPADLHRLLRERFGFAAFRPFQEETIRSVMQGRSTLAVLPTSAGKSLCYQLPALALDGLTLVISPLIALMQDQVAALGERGIPALALTGGLSGAEMAQAYRRIAAGDVRLLYVAPERLRSAEFRRVLDDARVDLLAVDEAHCVSQWGHDFRPDYLLIQDFRRRLGHPRLLALTATAPAKVREDIVAGFGVEEVLVAPWDRPNLRYGALELQDDQERERALLRWLSRLDGGSAIVYTLSRRAAEEWAEKLGRGLRRTVLPYHAGMAPEERKATQERFMSGEAPVIVATNAFGMGVDKPDIRMVLHVTAPESLEAYAQESGRAGRDGEGAWALILWTPQDLDGRRFLLEQGRPDEAWLGRHLAELRAVAPGQPWRIAEGPDERAQATLLLSQLVQRGIAGADARRPQVEEVRLRRRLTQVDQAEILAGVALSQKAKTERLKTVQAYLRLRGCRRDFLLEYFAAPRPKVRPDVCCDGCHPEAFHGRPARAVPKPGLRGPAPVRRPAGPEVREGARPRAAQGTPERRPASASPWPQDTARGRLLAWRRAKALQNRLDEPDILSDEEVEALLAAMPESRAALEETGAVGYARRALFGEEILGALRGDAPDPGRP